jgi:hypothetical protein
MPAVPRGSARLASTRPPAGMYHRPHKFNEKLEAETGAVVVRPELSHSMLLLPLRRWRQVAAAPFEELDSRRATDGEVPTGICIDVDQLATRSRGLCCQITARKNSVTLVVRRRRRHMRRAIERYE